MKIHIAGDNGRHQLSFLWDSLIKLNNENLSSGNYYQLQFANRGGYNVAKRLNLMKIFFAGGVTGNLREFSKTLAKVNGVSKEKVVECMKLYIAGSETRKDYIFENLLSKTDGGINFNHINILESYYYLRNNEEFMKLVPYFGLFLLDSGAFTFMSGSHIGSINWDGYVEEYASFINRHDVKLFFELDIDSLVGLSEVERLRYKLESLTGKKPIPVWHKNRGKQYFEYMCKSYPYVAIGGIVTKEIPRNIYEKAFPWFISTAHKSRAKIHGLGYTTINNLSIYHFDSVDSTAWLYGNRGGYLYRFNPKTALMEQIKVPPNHRMKSRECAVHNFNEWVKFSKYAEINL